MEEDIAMVKVCVLTGFGINCDYETEHAFKLAGAKAQKVHLQDVIDGIKNLSDYQILAFPGGFSFGDDIASGKVMANKFKTALWDDMKQFVEDGKLVIGICNGFQIMVKMGLLPDIEEGQTTTLSINDSGKFEDRWVYLKKDAKTKCVWTQAVDKIYLPIRHGEGKFIVKDKNVLGRLELNKQIVFRYTDEKYEPTSEYPQNPNGSIDNIAGICDKTGRVFGLMPHPEAFVTPQNHPRWTRENIEKGDGLKIFINAVNYAKKNLK
ncbi:phosphoribosylformylglycinamidine synthase I [Candidatus Woesearchaeota archaeon]|nr:phosphoribosylformylglycinamidine synthase I [Candidatus Woesearchaeota archaeon]